MCLQSFAGAMSSVCVCVCLADFGFNADNNNEKSEDNAERQFINLTCDFRFFFSASLKAD